MNGERLACKVFSATTTRDREKLGERITEWIRKEGVEPQSCQVLQSSDNNFHCISMVLLYSLPES